MSPSSIWNRKGVISLIGLKIKYYFNDIMENKARQPPGLEEMFRVQHKSQGISHDISPYMLDKNPTKYMVTL